MYCIDITMFSAQLSMADNLTYARMTPNMTGIKVASFALVN